jgi:hypothetical protein
MTLFDIVLGLVALVGGFVVVAIPFFLVFGHDL